MNFVNNKIFWVYLEISFEFCLQIYNFSTFQITYKIFEALAAIKFKDFFLEIHSFISDLCEVPTFSIL